MNPKTPKISYEPEADVLRFELSSRAIIDYARELGNVVVHFTKDHVPVYLEILEARQFLKGVGKVMPREAVLELAR